MNYLIDSGKKDSLVRTCLPFVDSSAVPEKKLFTPGPLSVSLSVREAALRDLGSRDTEFIATVKFLRSKLLQIAGTYYILTCI